MATWGEYQSAIQLGAALNIGYAAFDLVFRNASSPVINAFTHMEDVVRNAVTNRTEASVPGDLSANRFQLLKRCAGIIKLLSRWVDGGSPVIPIISSVAGMILLVISSERYGDQIGLVSKFFVLSIGYSWILFMCVSIAISYFLFLRVKK